MTFPTKDQARDYKCELRATRKAGHPVTFTASATVTELQANDDHIVSRALSTLCICVATKKKTKKNNNKKHKNNINNIIINNNNNTWLDFVFAFLCQRLFVDFSDPLDYAPFTCPPNPSSTFRIWNVIVIDQLLKKLSICRSINSKCLARTWRT